MEDGIAIVSSTNMRSIANLQPTVLVAACVPWCVTNDAMLLDVTNDDILWHNLVAEHQAHIRFLGASTALV
jgi:hypothetical protein